MAIAPPFKDPDDEVQAQLPGLPTALPFGRLTARLVQVIDRPAAEVGSLARIRENLGAELAPDYRVTTTEAAAERSFLAPSARQEALTLIRQLEQQPLRDALARLEQTLELRQEQGDAWPEGRLTAGILYAELGEYDCAEQRLDEAVRVLQGGSLFSAEQMAMAM